MDRGRVVRGRDGRALNVVGLVLDITLLKEAEQRQRLLFDELNHRVKNTLSIVQALAQQTLRTRPDPAEFNEAFADRLASLARAHSLLTNESWQGASLQEIVAAALEPFMDEAGRIRIEGPPARIPASATITLSLMLHELATNAAKYGALSAAAGSPVDLLGGRRGRHRARHRPALAGRGRPRRRAAGQPRLRQSLAGRQRTPAQCPVRDRLRAAGLQLPPAVHDPANRVVSARVRCSVADGDADGEEARAGRIEEAAGQQVEVDRSVLGRVAQARAGCRRRPPARGRRPRA